MLIILQELMYRTFVETEGRPPKREEIPKPCDYFDLIGGTGTGGLIAIMLGRLRLDLETCMDVYVRMTRKVFETDKTIIGIPYKQTLFKASKLEEAIKACVREHTIFEDEGNDGTATGGKEFAGASPMSSAPRRSMSVRSSSTLGTNPAGARSSMVIPAMASQWGNGDASLYDGREHRTKTTVTAVYKGTGKGGSSILLRSYESRKEPPPEFNCSIWQAGRATCATGLAFKPIKIGHSEFSDEGAGKYNPAPQILEEASVNEWPGREIGVFVSIGTGKRPAGTNNKQQEWWEGFVGSSLGNFAEARRRLIAKIEGCEDTHISLLNSELARRGVSLESYFRLNVEVGVGEFGMNEWDRMSEMTVNTRRYTSRPEVQQMLSDASAKLAKIGLAKRRYDGHGHRQAAGHESADDMATPFPHTHPPVVELPAESVDIQSPYSSDYRTHDATSVRLSSNSAYSYQQGTPSELSSTDTYMTIPNEPTASHRLSTELPYRTSRENIGYQHQQRQSYPAHNGDYGYNRTSPPPRPPKTPIEGHRPTSMGRPAHQSLPYPDTDGPPPLVNKLRKPEFTAR